MPVITFPQGPNTKEAPAEEQVDEVGTIDKISHYFECTECGSAVFHIYDDGEAQCVRCSTILSNVLILDMDAEPEKARIDDCA